MHNIFESEYCCRRCTTYVITYSFWIFKKKNVLHTCCLDSLFLFFLLIICLKLTCFMWFWYFEQTFLGIEYLNVQRSTKKMWEKNETFCICWVFAVWRHLKSFYFFEVRSLLLPDLFSFSMQIRESEKRLPLFQMLRRTVVKIYRFMRHNIACAATDYTENIFFLL